LSGLQDLVDRSHSPTLVSALDISYIISAIPATTKLSHSLQFTMAATEKTINLDGIVGEHDDKGKMEELTADMPSGPMGLIQNPYVSFVAFSIAFAGFMYGYPGVSIPGRPRHLNAR
jgi:hypothetical protein